MSDQDFVRRMPGSVAMGSGSRLVRVHLDPLMLFALLAIISYGLVVLFSAVEGNRTLFTNQLVRMVLALVAMVVAAQLQPRLYLRWAPFVYAAGVVLLVLVLVMGVKVKGSQRWLDLPGLPRFQPSELMKIGVPMMVAWYLHERPLPPSLKDVAVALVIVAVPAGCIILQPDLGTGILVAGAGFAVVVLAGIHWRWIAYAGVIMAAATVVVLGWFLVRGGLA